jgi:hypothetical protein
VDKTLDHGGIFLSGGNKTLDLEKNSVLFGYSLGKAQRILALLEPFADKPIFISKNNGRTHGVLST